MGRVATLQRGDAKLTVEAAQAKHNESRE